MIQMYEEKNNMKKLLILCTILFSFCFLLTSQEALKSTEEEYYDFLSLQGLIERPTLIYRTLSDSVWQIPEEDETSAAHVWSNNNLGTIKNIWIPDSESSNLFLNGIFQGVRYKILAPQWYNSYNSAAPYGQNDGAIWQGRGYNTYITGGFFAEAYGLTMTFCPQISFAQNLEFEYTTPRYSGDNYSGKATLYGDYSLGSIDAPQRFGDKSIFLFDLRD